MNNNHTDLDQPAEKVRMANIGAEFAGAFLMQQHRGVLDCGDHFLIFGNDGYKNDSRSHREVGIVLEELKDDDPKFGVSESQCTWAIVVTDYKRNKFDTERLSTLVWDAWTTVCTGAESVLTASSG